MAFEVYVIVQDAKGDKSTISIPVPSDITLTDIPEIVQDMTEFLVPMVTGGIVSAGLRVEVDVSGVSTTIAGAASDVQEKARFVFRGVNGFLKTLHIPTFLEDLFVAGTPDVDTTDVDVAAFVTVMEDGWLLDDAVTAVEPCDIRGDDLEDLVTAVEAWGKARR
jgi:hypothetical protein